MLSSEDFSLFDHQMMARAIQLAKHGRFTTTPNPNVGCVIVKNQSEIVGEGWHQKAGTPHAEIHALNQAADKAKGATAYVTLEPCSHHGRTGPCAEALVKAGITRVVAAMVDPNTNVSGQGFALLEKNHVDVAHGLLESEAVKLNRGFIKRMKTGRPWVTVKLAASLDGKTALSNGTSQWITSPAARQDVQIHRALSCAVLSGSGTVLADNPSLNVRYDELGAATYLIEANQLRQPLRIILDGKNQLTGQLKMFDVDGQTHVVNRVFNPQLPDHVKQSQIPSKGNKLDLHHLLELLGQWQLNQIWVEAGGMLAGALVQQNLVDELILYQAPKLLGDKGQNLFVMDELTEMQQAKQLQWSQIRQVGEDIKFTALFKDR